MRTDERDRTDSHAAETRRRAVLARSAAAAAAVAAALLALVIECGLYNALAEGRGLAIDAAAAARLLLPAGGGSLH